MQVVYFLNLACLLMINGDYDPIPGLYAAGISAGGCYNGLGRPPYEGLACGFAWTFRAEVVLLLNLNRDGLRRNA